MTNKIKEKRLKVTNLPQNGGYVPGIKLAGKYFQNLGFDYGYEVVVTPRRDGSLNIAKAREVKDEQGK